MREITESKFLSALKDSSFKTPDSLPEVFNKKVKIPLECACGEVKPRRVSDIISGVKSCHSCAAIKRDSATNSFVVNGRRINKVYDTEEELRFSKIMAGAKKRCHPTEGHKYYGLRGIEFKFASVREGAFWLRDNLGPCPEGYTLDRIDVNGHYEPSNLRWASRTTQRLNQREHDRLDEEGKRIRRLMEAKPEYHYETIRSFIKKGLTDNEIIAKRKGKHEKKNLRHS